MRTRILIGLITAVVLWGEAIAAAPGVPLAGVEVNSLQVTDSNGFGDGPNPFPHPTPPTPQPVPDGFLPTELLLDKHVEGATWFSYTPSGLAYHWCPGPVEMRLRGERPEVIELAKAMVAMPEVEEALRPWRTALTHEVQKANAARRTRGQDAIPIETVNEMWQARVVVHATEIAVAIPTMSARSIGRQECTTGPCNCGVCPPGDTCDCQDWDGNADYICTNVRRNNCNIDITPDPKVDGHMVDLRF